MITPKHQDIENEKHRRADAVDAVLSTSRHDCTAVLQFKQPERHFSAWVIARVQGAEQADPLSPPHMDTSWRAALAIYRRLRKRDLRSRDRQPHRRHATGLTIANETRRAAWFEIRRVAVASSAGHGRLQTMMLPSIKSSSDDGQVHLPRFSSAPMPHRCTNGFAHQTTDPSSCCDAMERRLFAEFHPDAEHLAVPLCGVAVSTPFLSMRFNILPRYSSLRA